ncbi:MAG: DISARM system phospholipase D-like protein DrmC [Dehalococcoidia bacterium]
MNESFEKIAEHIQRIASKVPQAVLLSLADGIHRLPPAVSAATIGRVLSTVAQPDYRSMVRGMLETWQGEAPEITAQSIALALQTASLCESQHRSGASVELVWTGPDSGAVPLRRTDQALLELINSATKRVVVVCFAIYKVDYICRALVEAGERGVDIDVVLESNDESEGKVTFDMMRALGSSIRSCARFYVWPLGKRPTDASGKHGSLHVKCATADGCMLLVSSANMELGVLVKDGPLPRDVESHFERLIQQGVLESCRPEDQSDE